MGDCPMRYFSANPAAYRSLSALLDAAYGAPRPGTDRVIPLPDMLPRSTNGDVAVSVPAVLCEIPGIRAVLAAALRSGAVAEITEAEYVAFARSWSPSP